MRKVFALIMLVALVGCSEKGAKLSCSDKEVTDLALEITKTESRNQFFKVFFKKEAGILTRDIADMKFDEFKAKATSDMGKKVVNETENLTDSLKLADVRLKEKNETTGMLTCATKLLINGEGSDISYTAQRTDEGKIYVEVFGL